MCRRCNNFAVRPNERRSVEWWIWNKIVYKIRTYRNDCLLILNKFMVSNIKWYVSSVSTTMAHIHTHTHCEMSECVAIPLLVFEWSSILNVVESKRNMVSDVCSTNILGLFWNHIIYWSCTLAKKSPSSRHTNHSVLFIQCMCDNASLYIVFYAACYTAIQGPKLQIYIFNIELRVCACAESLKSHERKIWK